MYMIDTSMEEDIVDVYDALRPADREYLSRVSGLFPLEALLDAFHYSEQTLTFHDHGTVVAVLGRTGCNVWLQTTALTDIKPRAVIKAGRKAMGQLPEYPLYCMVPVADRRVQTLCKAMGFTREGVFHADYKNSGIDHIALWRI